MARRRDDDEYLDEGYERENVFVPIDTFMRKEIGKEYSPFDDGYDEEMVEVSEDFFL